MKKWKTTLHLNHNNGSLKSRRININSGIFQGDSLSSFLFCLALAPLSTCLNNTKQGYEINKRKINYLFYMDDLKAYAMNDNQLKNLLDIVNTFSDDIKMEFGLDKCAKATFIKGKLTKTSNIVLNQTTYYTRTGPRRNIQIFRNTWRWWHTTFEDERTDPKRILQKN